MRMISLTFVAAAAIGLCACTVVGAAADLTGAVISTTAEVTGEVISGAASTVSGSRKSDHDSR